MVRITSSSLGKVGGPRRGSSLFSGGLRNVSSMKLAWATLMAALLVCSLSWVSTPLPKGTEGQALAMLSSSSSSSVEDGGEEKLDDTEAAAVPEAGGGDDEVGELEDPEEVGGESRGGRIGRRPEAKESFTDAEPDAAEPRRGLAVTPAGASAMGAADVKEEVPRAEEEQSEVAKDLGAAAAALQDVGEEEIYRKKLSGTAIWASGAVAVNDDDDDETSDQSALAKRKRKKEQLEERDRQTDAMAKRKRNMPKPWMAPKGEKPIATVAYAVSLTGCPEEETLIQMKGGSTLGDGGAVLRHSIHLNSAQHAPSRSKYDYQMVAIVHPNAVSCSSILQRVGYKIIVRDIPVPLNQIKGKSFREKVVKNGCCGEKEFIKLHAYTLTDFPIVVHLDLDTLVYQPMDEIFDAILETTEEYAPTFRRLKRSHEDVRSTLERVVFHGPSQKRGDPLPKQIDAFFTRDYNMVRPGRKHVGVQGGFLVLRPSMAAYRHYSNVIREGNFDSQKGWGKKGFGPFYGSMTFQGIVPYYYDALHPNTAVELNRCVYNQMCDNPRDQPTINNVAVGRCRDGRVECEDCRDRPFEDVRMAHFTLCQKPWWCMNHDATRIQHRLCKDLHREWFRVRDDLEKSWWNARQEEGGGGRKERKRPGGSFQASQFYGFCKFGSKKGYIPIDLHHIPESFAGPEMEDAHGLLASQEEEEQEEEEEEEEETEEEEEEELEEVE